MVNTETELKKDDGSKALVLTRAFEAVGRQQPNFDLAALDEADPDQSFKNNISAIAQGATQQNKVAFSANRQLPHDQEKSVKAEQQAARDDEARELQHLMEWNAQKTTLSGVEMTNEEAQEARQGVIDNDDYYARWAVKKGYIKADQVDDFKDGIRRKKEWQHNRGLGTNTAADDAAEEKFDRSDIGKGTTLAATQYHQSKGVLPSIDTVKATSDSELKSKVSASSVTENYFQNAPKLGSEFSSAQVATVPLEPKTDNAPSPAPWREVKAMGFDA